MNLAERKISRVKKWFIISIILLPILFLYATPIPGFTIGDLFMLVWTFSLLIKEKVKINNKLLLLIFFLVIQTLTLSAGANLPKITTSLRYIVYLLIMWLLPTVANERDYIYKVVSQVSKAVIIFLLLQYVAFQMGIIIPGIMTFLPLTADEGSSYEEIFNIGGRCMSVFAEPSHYAIYALLFLTISLFEHSTISFKNLIWPVITSFSLIAASSFSGVLCMVAAWTLKLVLSLRNKKLSIKAVITFFLFIGVLVYIILSTNMGDYVSDIDVYDRQSAGRFGGFTYVMEKSSQMSNLLFGNGMNDIGEVEYLSGWPRLYFYFGILGSLIYLISFGSFYKKNTLSMVIMIMVAGLMVGTEINFAPFILPYVLLASATKDYSLKNI